MSNRNLRLISIALFAISLTQKCYCTTSTCGDSILVVLIGWLGLFSGGATLTWLANPFLVMSWILLEKNLKASMIFSALAGLLSLAFLMFDGIVDTEAGHVREIVSYKAGYWLWLGSCWVMLTGTFWLQWKENKRSYNERAAADRKA